MLSYSGSRSSGEGAEDDDTSIIEPEQGNGQSTLSKYVILDM